MDEPRARRLEELFALGLEVDVAERAAWLARLADDDARLRPELESLFEHLERCSRFLAEPALDAAAFGAHARAPARIGSYRVLHEIGRGGMGVVYAAEQERPRRRVALKVIRPGITSAAALKRFEHEAAALARLQHPHIAQIFDAGSADWGAGPQPYFAMEYVEGRTLGEHVAAQRPGVRERLELLAQACDALEHAHERGVVHRDLKPSNLLVELVTGTGTRSHVPRVKVLDFGIARVTATDAHTVSQLTDAGQVIGTLPYMSPEQASGGSTGVDLRTDVYSLGAIGYELVAGAPPLDVLGRPLVEAVQIVRDVDPTPLCELGLRPVVDRELATIFAKALEKDPARRYASAGELAADLRRHLADLPIVARPASRTYRMAKFARRNRVLVSGAALVFLSLAGGLVATLRQATVAAAERDRADDEARVAVGVADFQREMLSRVNPASDGRDVRLADVLDASAVALPGALAGQPAVEGGVRAMLGESYLSLALLEQAEEQLARAVELLAAARGADHDVTLRAKGTLASVVADRGRTAEAARLDEEVLRAWTARHGQGDAEALTLELNLAGLYAALGRDAEAEQLTRENLAQRREVFGDDDPRTLNAWSMLAQMLWSRGALAEAEPLLRRVLERGIAVEGARHPHTLQREAELASVLLQLGRLDEAEVLLRRTIAVAREVLGDEHIELLAFEHNLAQVLERRGAIAEAEALLRRVVGVQEHVLGADHADAWTAQQSLAALLFRQRRFAEAELLFTRVLEAKQRALAPDDASLVATQEWLERTREGLALVKR